MEQPTYESGIFFPQLENTDAMKLKAGLYDLTQEQSGFNLYTFVKNSLPKYWDSRGLFSITGIEFHGPPDHSRS